jgi:aspartate carbamoyltransferase catalytic subunit
MHHNGLGVKKRSYSIKTKKQIITDYELEMEINQKIPGVTIATKYNITESQLSKWLKAKDVIQNQGNRANLLKIHPGPAIKVPEMNLHVSNFDTNRREQNLKATPKQEAISLNINFMENSTRTSLMNWI